MSLITDKKVNKMCFKLPLQEQDLQISQLEAEKNQNTKLNKKYLQ